jgi:hypothetical protein
VTIILGHWFNSGTSETPQFEKDPKPAPSGPSG